MELVTKNYRAYAILTGILFLITDITAIVGLLIYKPLLNNPNLITSIDFNVSKIVFGTFLEIILAICNIGTALVLYPILKKFNHRLALGYVVFRALEATLILIGVICILTIVSLHLEFLTHGGDGAVFQMLSKMLVEFQKWTFLFGPNIVLPINGTILGYLLFKSKLVPRVISALYLFDGPILFISSIFVLFGFYEASSKFAILVAMPMLAFEVSFSLWLILKGFNAQTLNANNDN